VQHSLILGPRALQSHGPITRPLCSNTKITVQQDIVKLEASNVACRCFLSKVTTVQKVCSEAHAVVVESFIVKF